MTNTHTDKFTNVPNPNWDKMREPAVTTEEHKARIVEAMRRQHTDSLDHWDLFIDELEPFNVPPQVMNRLCSHFRTTLQTTHQQQVEEAVRKTRVQIKQDIMKQTMTNVGSDMFVNLGEALFSCESKEDRRAFLKMLRAPNHQD